MRLCLLFIATMAGSTFAAEARRPNLLFIIADDCTHRDLGCYGGQAHTPNIDRLAEQGMRFTRCFQAAPMCSPTRHNIYTGLYPVKSGAYPNHTFVKDGVKSVVDYLKPIGYRVALSGKTHINPRKAFRFEYSAEKNNPDMNVIDALFRDCAESETPFCLFACSNEPHSPWDKGDPSRYPAEEIKLPPYFVDTPVTRQNMSKYLAEITYYDSQVGKCLELLEKHKLADNTLVMVVSEQGSGLPFAKWTCYDSGLQSACIVRWPGRVQPGSVSDAMIEYVDILPTFLAAVGAKPPQVLDGRSFVPVLDGKTNKHKDYVYGIHTTRGIINGSDYFGIRSVRSTKFKLIRNLTPDVKFTNACTHGAVFKSWKARAQNDPDAADKVHRYHHRPAVELFDITKDPLEWTNLAGNPEFTEVQKELSVELDRWMESQGDKGQQTELDALQHQAKWARRNKKGKK